VVLVVEVHIQVVELEHLGKETPVVIVQMITLTVMAVVAELQLLVVMALVMDNLVMVVMAFNIL
jgi:hypothetical protein